MEVLAFDSGASVASSGGQRKDTRYPLPHVDHLPRTAILLIRIDYCAICSGITSSTMSDGRHSYDDSNRAFLQALMARSTLTLTESKPILAAILSVHSA